RFVAASCGEHGTRIWDTSRGQLVAELPSPTEVPGDFTSSFAAVSMDGDRAAIADGETVKVYELPSRKLLREVAHGALVNSVAFAPSGHALISGAIDGSLIVTSDNGEKKLTPSSGGIDAAEILADGRMVAADAH